QEKHCCCECAAMLRLRSGVPVIQAHLTVGEGPGGALGFEGITCRKTGSRPPELQQRLRRRDPVALSRCLWSCSGHGRSGSPPSSSCRSRCWGCMARRGSLRGIIWYCGQMGRWLCEDREREEP